MRKGILGAAVLLLIGAAFRVGLAICAVLFTAVCVFPAQLLCLLTQDQEVTVQALSYFKIISFSYPIFVATNLLVIALRSVGQVKIGLLLPLSTLFVNITLNYCLIYGRLGFLEYGIQGAAIATLCSRIMELVLLINYLGKRERVLKLSPARLWRIDKTQMKVYLRVTVPILISQFQWGIAQTVQTAILGFMGKSVLAANSIAVMVFQVLTVIVYGSAGATGILIGEIIESGEQKLLHRTVHTFQWLFLLLGGMYRSAYFTGARPDSSGL